VKRFTENGTATCSFVSMSLSEYLEGGLPPPVRREIDFHIVECDSCAEEVRQLASLLRLLKAIPRREPTLDMWVEMAPKVAAYQAEERLSVVQRLRLRLGRFLGNFAAGAILFTQALALNTESHLKKYLMTDPYHLAEEER